MRLNKTLQEKLRQEIVKGIREELANFKIEKFFSEGYKIYHKIGEEYKHKIFEEEFERKMFYWSEEDCIDHFYYATGIYNRLNESIPTKEIELLEELLDKLFLEAEFEDKKIVGGYTQCSKSYPTIYSTFCAIAAVSNIITNRKGKNLEYPIKLEEVKDISKKIYEKWEERKNKIYNFIIKSYFDLEGEENLGMIKEHPGMKEKKSTFLITITALKLLFMLFEESELKSKNNDYQLILKCINSLRKCKKINRKYVAFSSTPKNNYKNLYLCTLYFAIRPFLLKDRFKNLTNLLLGDGGELFSRDEREKVINFICDCWNEKEGGFAISPFAISPFEGVPTIIHTKFALKLLCEYFERDIDFTTRSGKKVQISDIKNFLNSCERNSGYSFRSSYQPNIYALRNAVDIMKTLKKKNKIDESEFTNFKEKTMGILKKYYFHSSGYQGYPKENE